MSTALTPRPRTATSHTTHISIVASIYNEHYTNALVQNCKDELSKILPNIHLDIARVPGAFEIPVVCELLLSQPKPPQIIITLGLLIQGETKHADLVAESVTMNLQAMAIKHKAPILHEVILVNNEQQAHERCIEPKLNRGREAARSAYTMTELFSVMKPNRSSKH